MTHLVLSPQTMRLMVDLRRLLQRDHGVDIDIDDDYALESLLDAARVAKDNQAEQLAYAICDTLTAAGPGSEAQVKKLCARVSQRFREPLYSRGAGAARMYRGNPLPTAESARGADAHPVVEDAGDDDDKVIIYRGQRVRKAG